MQNKDPETETTIGERFVSGAVAGFLSQTAVYPLDVKKNRQISIFSSLISTFRF